MTLIDFYVLKTGTLDERQQFACRLIEKAVRQGDERIAFSWRGKVCMGRRSPCLASHSEVKGFCPRVG